MPNSSHTPPSFYPDPTIPTKPQAPNQPQKPSAEPHQYELLIEVVGQLRQVERTSGQPIPPQHAALRIFQGRRISQNPSDSPTYHAFLSVQSINIPLLSSHVASRLNTPPYRTFQLSIPDSLFHITLSETVEPHLVQGFETILRWFCLWQTPESIPDGAESRFPHPPEDTSVTERAIHRAGDTGVRIVERLGTAINDGVSRHMSKRVEDARGAEMRSMNLGGNITSKTLSGTRSVITKGASMAASASESISEAVGKGIANNSVSKNMREAPRGSAKRSFYDHLIAGLMTIGKVYVAADKQGRAIIENVSNGAAELTGVKYGPEAENATRQFGSITLNGYRIMRFPQKLGATAVLKGAMKSRYGETYVDPQISGEVGDPAFDSSGFGNGRPFIPEHRPPAGKQDPSMGPAL